MLAVIVLAAAPVLDFTGLAALITAVGSVMLTVGTLLNNRQRRLSHYSRQAVLDLEHRDVQYKVAIRHIRALEDALLHAGVPVPERPAELSVGWWHDTRVIAREASDR